jgi:hypothetical protein
LNQRVTPPTLVVMRKILTLLMLMLGLAITNAASNGVTVDVTFDQSQFLPGETIVAAVRINNLSGQDIELGEDNQWLTFYMQADGGYIVPLSSLPPVTGRFTLHSAQVATRRVNITPYFNLTHPGRYRLTATVTIPQWSNQQVTSRVTTFMIMTGVHLANAPEIEFGVPARAGETNHAPEIRKYSLEKATYAHDLRLYLRLSDISGKALRVFPIDRMVSFSSPEAQIDGDSNLHVLHQTGARSFNYCIIDTDGDITLRQTYDYTATRPTLSKNNEGKIFVAGGIRRLSPRDFQQTASIPATKPDAQVTSP